MATPSARICAAKCQRRAFFVQVAAIRLHKGSFSPHKIFEQTCLCSNFVAPSLMFDDGGTALTFTLSGFPRRSHSTWTSRLGGNDPGFSVTIVLGPGYGPEESA